MMGQYTVSPSGVNESTVAAAGDSPQQHLSAADIVAMLGGLSAEQQTEFYQTIGLEHEQQFYSLLGLCPSTNDSVNSQVRSLTSRAFCT